MERNMLKWTKLNEGDQYDNRNNNIFNIYYYLVGIF